jgi:hypothetical protein
MWKLRGSLECRQAAVTTGARPAVALKRPDERPDARM